MRRIILTVLVVSPGCGSGGGVVEQSELPGRVDEDVESTSDVEWMDLGGGELTTKDLTTDAGLDLVFPDAVKPDSMTPACDPGEGCFLDKCEDNADCQSGWCVDHMGDGVCSIGCTEECPNGWSCQQVAGTAPDLVYVCVSDYANLCKPCASGDNCKSVGGADDVCVDYGDEGAFCGGACTTDDDCPWGFSCVESQTVDGVPTSQCVADAGVCPCTAKAVTLSLFTLCAVENEFGVCEGKRICGDDGLSQCDAAVPTAEVCNGLDDDCDGEVDEPNAVDGKYVDLCEDDNECTEDVCLGEAGCEQTALSEGECKDGDSCTVGDHCADGICVGTPIQCDDQNPCTDDSCNGLGGCLFENNSADCDDGDPCTVADECNGGECSGVAITCDCQNDADCGALEDGDLCNGTLVCNTAAVPFQCEVDPDTVVTCPAPEGDQAACLAAACDPDSGSCDVVPANDGFACDDGDACTLGELCLDGLCQGGGAALCNDNNPCTDDSCDAELGCLHDANDEPCDDDDVCTVGEVCAAGICGGGEALLCDDGNECTADTCDQFKGCLHAAMDGACDDGNACTLNDQCAAGKCKGGVALGCDDDNVCTTDSCDPVQGCVHALNQAPCDDGNVCTTGDHCSLGECISAGSLTCSDNNPCTDDACDGQVGCTFTPNNAPCDDGNACTKDDACNGGQCKPGKSADCDDENLCTDDFCDFEVGCLNVNNKAPCDDGNKCTANETCSEGSCGAGVPVLCNDDNLCTDDSCAPDVGCIFTNNSVACDDGLACTDGDACADGSCQAGGATDCDDGNPCTEDACSEPDGCLHTNLEDGTTCGEEMHCQAGVCEAICVAGSVTLTYIGAPQYFDVPACATKVVLEVWGAEGGTNGAESSKGKGGYAKGESIAVAGKKLHVYVGGRGKNNGNTAIGGWNGGGGHAGGNNTNGGGGATDIRVDGPNLSHRIIVAGGGGGSAWCYSSTGVGGDGGPETGENGGYNYNATNAYGRGGTQNAGGLGGTFSSKAPNGSLGQGGGAYNDNSGCGGAGAGGGGYYGGGGGAHGGGGGGGSSWVGTLLNTQMQRGTRSGDGSAKISWE